MLDPNSAVARRLDRQEGARQEIQGRIQHALKLFEDIKKQNVGKPGLVEIRVHANLPCVNLVRSDSALIVIVHMPPLYGYELFTFRAQNISGGIFEQYEKYFEAVWSDARVWEQE